MTINTFDVVGNNFFDNYLYLDGISDSFGYKKFEVVDIKGNQYALQETAAQNPDYLSTALKIISYFTVILPFIALVGKLAFRLLNDFIVQPQAPVTIGSYNILFPQKLPVSKYSTSIGYSSDESGMLYENSAFRTPIIQKNLENANLDIVCLQEMTQDTETVLESSPLGEKYNFIWELHRGNSHGVAVLYDKSRFQMIGDPQKCKSLKNRVHVITNLQDKTTQKIYRVASCHLLDSRDKLNGNGEHTQAVVDSVSSATADYTIIAGDMNQDESGFDSASPAFQPLLDNGYNCDNNRDSSEFTKKEFDNGPIISKKRRIDWIWAKGATPLHLPLSDFDNRGSDHRLVAVTI